MLPQERPIAPPKPLILVSGSSFVRERVAPCLERAGFAVRLIETVPEAIQLLEETGEADVEGNPHWLPELIIVDSFMDKETGSQALRMLTWAEAHPQYRHVPFINIADKPDRDMLFEWYYSRPDRLERKDCYVTKPFSEMEVVAFARRALFVPRQVRD